MTLPIAHWQAALDQMGSALATAARSLDRAEERFERAFAPSAGEGELPPAVDRLDARLRDWEERLRAADALTESVEQELTDRTGAVARWRAQFARWEELLQRK
jgi:phage shock protein A